MSDITFNIKFPLDEDNFFRRECPYCKNQFKILIKEEDLNSLTEYLIDDFLKENDLTSKNNDQDGKEEINHFCPYCSQSAHSTKWWTKQQLDYAMMFAKNIFNRIINENLIKKMRSISRSNRFIKFEGKELEYNHPWIQPEENDMDIKDLLCCNSKLKLDSTYIKNAGYYCYYCGFKHKSS